MEKEFDFLNDKALCVINDTEPCVIKYNGETIRKLSAIKDTEQGTTEVTYNSEYKKNLLNMAVEGNTEQKTTTGKNLIDPEKLAELIMSYDPNAKLMEVDGRRCIKYRNSATYQKDLTSCCPEFKAKTRYIFSVEAKPYTIMPETQQYDGGFQITFKPTANSDITPNRLSAKTTTEFTRIYTISKSNTTVDDISLTWGTQWDWLIDLDTVYLYEYEGDNNPPYEEYTGRIPSPNVEYPQPIENSTNISAELRGVNLVDENNMYKGYFIVSNGEMQFTGTNSYRSAIIPNLKAGVYTLSFSENFYVIRLYVDGKEVLVGSNLKRYSFTCKQDGTVGICFRKKDSSAINEDFTMQVNEGTRALPYQPYFAPTKVDIPLTLRGIGDRKDNLSIDYINKKAIVKRNVFESDLLDLEWSLIKSTNNNTYFQANINKSFTSTGGYCNRCKVIQGNVTNENLADGEFKVYFNGDVITLVFASNFDLKKDTNSKLGDLNKLNQWLTNNPTNIALALLFNDTEEYKEEQWVKDLLALPTQNATNIINISADVPVSKLNVDYAVWGGRENENN